MSNKNKFFGSNEKPEETVEPATYSNKALAIFKDKDGRFVLAEVGYNPTDSNVKQLVKDVREDVIDRFKMAASELFMGVL